MAPSQIIDSHIHLWPNSAANEAGHAWMSQGDLLAKQHLLEDYYAVTSPDKQDPSAPEVRGVIYIETDRRLEPAATRDLRTCAAQPLEEIRFLRSIVEGQYGARDKSMLSGLVIWAPMDQGPEVFEQWMSLAEETAGKATWSRVKGFRFLLQAMTDKEKFESLVFSEGFITILKSFNARGRRFSFDVGIDQHSGGVWQLEAFAKVIERVREDKCDVTFILNHLCKPDMTVSPSSPTRLDDFGRWSSSLQRMAGFPNVYMKLSGAFSELSAERVDTASLVDIAHRMEPWLDQLFSCFTPERIMFGSDWPVCNVRGPRNEKSWGVWRRVVQTVLEQRGFSEQQQQMIWSGTAVEAYRLHD